MEAHQERVVVEKRDLDEKIAALNVFINITNLIYEKLPQDEQNRLRSQLDVMQEYSAILKDRIANFPRGDS